MADPTNINTMQLLSAQNQPNSDSEDASAAGTYGVRPEFQQIQATIRALSLNDGWETINGLLNVAWTGGLVPTYIDPNNFSYQGNQTSYFTVNRRVKAIVNTGNIYGTISTSSYSSGPNSTTVTVTWDSTSLDPTVSDVQISALNPAFSSIPALTPAVLPATVEQSITTPLAAIATGTNTYAATLSPVPTSYITNQHYWIVFTNANDSAVVLNLNGLGNVPIVKNVNVNLVRGDIEAGQALELFYDGTNFQVIGAIGLDSVKVFKDADQVVNNSTVLINDTELVFNVSTNETWRFSFMLYITTGASAANGGFIAAITFPNLSVMSWSISSVSFATTGSGTSKSILAAANANTDYMVEIIGNISSGNTPGAVQLQWAQASGTSTNTTVKYGSNLIATRVNP